MAGDVTTLPVAQSRAVNDGLANVISGVGTTAGKNAYNRYSLTVIDVAQIEMAYRSSWLARKAHDLPPKDMTRKWRDLQAEAAAIKAIEKEERRLAIRAKARQALVWARLYGGAALILGAGAGGDPEKPLNTQSIGKGGLRYVHVVTRHQLTIPELDLDPESEFFQQPTFYEMTSQSKGQVRLHPSRVIPFIGQPLPNGLMTPTGGDQFWGDPLLQSVVDALQNADLTQSGIAEMINEAKIDTVSLPGLMSQLSTAEYEERLMRRLNLANLAKSLLNTRLMDSEEKWETRQLSFDGLPDVLTGFLQCFAGAVDIPLTRLLGTSAKGLNATGEGDSDNWDEAVMAKQEDDLRPALERLDEVMVPSAVGSMPADYYWTFKPLDEPTEEERATVGKTKAETTQIYANSGLIPDTALATAVQNQLIEDGTYPGLEAALAKAEEAGDVPPITEEPDPSALTVDPKTGLPMEPKPGEAVKLPTVAKIKPAPKKPPKET